MTPTVFSSELLELLERYRRRHIHLVKPSSEPWQIELDAETYALQRTQDEAGAHPSIPVSTGERGEG